MRAVVVSPNAWVEVGTVIEVVGFVHYASITWAVYRDDYGTLDEIPAWAIRMQPAVAVALPPSDPALMGHTS